MDDLLGQRRIGGGELMMPQLLGRNPGQLLAGEGFGLAIFELADEWMQANLKLGIGVSDCRQRFEVIDGDIQLLAQLAMEAIDGAFARLLLAAGEFPVVGEGVAFAPFGDQDF